MLVNEVDTGHRLKPAAYDYVLVGGGLQNALIALRLLAERPGLRLALVERQARLGGNHTWSFHAGDLSPAMAAVVAPLLAAHWPGYTVTFPDRDRSISRAYAAIVSDRLHEGLVTAFANAPAADLYLGTAATEISADRVTLADGRVLDAVAVIDARGPERFQPSRIAGYQKFCGLELALAEPNAPELPVLMDARVPQRDGFRFVYLLPFAADRVLVEDTYYSSSPALDTAALAEGIIAYATERGLRVRHVHRQETGVLPLPSALAPPTDALVAGYGGGFFHPTTGYSFPVAARLADAVAAVPPAQAVSAVARLRRELFPQTRFAVRLNQLLFGAFADERRWQVLSHFYRLPAETVERFYAMTMTPADRLRVFLGRPPRGFSLVRLLTKGGSR